MAYADGDLDSRSGHAYQHPAPSSPPPHRTHPRRAYGPARDAAMNRDDGDRRDRGRSDRDPRDRSHERPRSISPAPRRGDLFRDSRDYSRDGRRENYRDRERDRERDRDWDRDRDRDRDDLPKGPRQRSPSPASPGKRRRSPSLGPSHRNSKKSKREREREKRRAKKNRPRPSSPGYRRSPSPYHGRRSFDRPDLFDPPPPRRSRSPHYPRDPDLDREPSTQPRPRRPSFLSDRSRSPRPGSRHSTHSRAHSPHPLNHSEAGSYSRRSTPAFESHSSNRPPRSPRNDRPPPAGPSLSRGKKKRREDTRLGKRAQPSSGANSIEVSMNRRGDMRSSFGPGGPSTFTITRSGDPRHNQSPTRVTPGSSRHGSPVPHSPQGRGGRGGPPQYSPQNGPSSGSQAHYSQSPPHPPSGPLNSGRGFSRGGFRGGSFSSGRPAGPRAASGFNPPTGPAAERGGHNSQSGESTPSYAANSHVSDTAVLAGDDTADERNSRLSKEPQDEDTTMTEKKDDEQTSGPSRAPPTGPAASTPSGPKFSFAFKATSKAPVAAPKPEISQKFSAAPPRREPPQPADDQSSRDQSSRDQSSRDQSNRDQSSRDQSNRDQSSRDQNNRDRSNRDRDLPRDTPTGPASSRAREAPTGPASSRGRAESDYRGRPRAPEPPKPPRPPRIRRIKKVERVLKPKPVLPEQLATSVSPFYRKQGNESVVGSGTYGKVYKGKQIYSSRLVALKKIRMEGERDGFPVTAMREIKLLQSLRHDNIVALQEVMVERNDCFMVFEYLSHDLTGLLNHPSFKLDAAQKKHLAKQLFEGLDYLHTRGVLHRDIKAANILVSSDGVLKLADFGLARFYAKHHNVDYTNRVITIWYRSPELLLGETQYNAAVDVWSAACVMVEIFTRHAIFPGDGTEINQLDKIYAVLGTPNKGDWPDLVKMEWFELLRPGYRRPSVFTEKYKDRVPPAAFELLAAMFQYDPARRPSAGEVLNHAYFTTEQPPPRQAVELADIQGEWHEFESKALRREKERKERLEREARRNASSKAKESERPEKDGDPKERDKKRPGPPHDSREAKRPHIENRPSSSSGKA